MMAILDVNMFQSENNLFYNESTFTLHGNFNLQNWLYWSDENSHWIKYPENVYV